MLQRALATNGFLAADRTHHPALMLIFHWGTHHALDPDMRGLFPELARRHLLERSILVGGRRFETSVARRMAYGDSLPDHTSKTEFLTDQANQGVYFVVVSAYDIASLQQSQRRLAWRMSLTVNTVGVSMTDSLPALILTAAPSFGRDMAEPNIVLRRVRRGIVEIGPTTVVESNVPLPAAKKPD